MNVKTCVSILLLPWLSLLVYGSDQASKTISPGKEIGIAVINDLCPTFSWTAAEGAVTYRLEVFETQDASTLPHSEIAAAALPILGKEIQGAATSWTPSSEERLYEGVSFVWYIQAIDPYGNGIWSEGKLFRVDAVFWPAEIDDKLGETLKEYGVSDGAVSKAIAEIKSDVVEGMTGKVDNQDNPPSAPANNMITAAYEQWDNTFYGYYTGNFVTSGKYNALFGSYAGQLLSSGMENAVVGHEAANSISSGFRNAFVGYRSGYMNSSGYQNTFVGHKSGLSNSDGIDNVFVGDRAGQSNVAGSNNVFLGATAGNYATATGNVFIGYAAGYWNSGASGNCFIGYKSGFANTSTGVCNTFTGYSSGRENTSGSYNSFYGHNCGISNTTADHNTYFGYHAGYSNTTGYGNTFIGSGAGTSNTVGMGNVFLGWKAGIDNTTGGGNSFMGCQAGVLNTTGTGNTFTGYNSGSSNTTANGNTFSGYCAGFSNTVGYHNTFVGYGAGFSNLDTQYGTFVGSNAGYNNLAPGNTFIGYQAGYANTTGSGNTCLGVFAGESNIVGGLNTFVGNLAGHNCHASGNTMLGYMAGSNNPNGSHNVCLGFKAGYYETGSHKLYIENSDTNDPLIYGEFDNDILGFMGSVGIGTKSPAYPMEMKKTGANASIVVDRTDGATNYINATATAGNFGTVTNHVLRLVVGSEWKMRLHTDNSMTFRNGASCTSAGVWTNASSRALKENIESLTTEEAEDALMKLDPVKYNYKTDKADKYVGFIAEDVPELVASQDRKGMSPMDVVAVLTKVLQEQQKINREQQETITELKAEVEELKKGSKIDK